MSLIMLAAFLNNFVFMRPIMLPWYLKLIPHFSLCRVISILQTECFFDNCVQKLQNLNYELIELLCYLFISPLLGFLFTLYKDGYSYKKKNSDSLIRNSEQIESEGLQVMKLKKTYKTGKQQLQALKGISFDIQKGEIFGLLGPNGAGKSTLISILVGLIEQDEGNFYISGKDGNTFRKHINQKIGVCTQFDCLWEDLTIYEHIDFYLSIRGICKKRRKIMIQQILQEVHLWKDQTKKVKELSGGMKRRVSIAISLSGDTDCVFLDEPTTGLDPINRIEIWGILQEAKKNRAILLTTHLMEEADQLCDRIGILNKGQLLGVDYSVVLKRKYGSGQKLHIKLNKQITNKDQILQKLYEVDKNLKVVQSDDKQLLLKVDIMHQDIFEIQRVLETKELKSNVKSWNFSQSNLREVFINRVRSNAQLIMFNNQDQVKNFTFFIEQNQHNRRFKFFSIQKNKLEFKKFIIILVALICQHINLFEFDLYEYNFKLIFYVLLISSNKLFKKYVKYIGRIYKEDEIGTYNFFVLLQNMLKFSQVYFLCFMYKEYTKIKIFILIYYYIQRFITREFFEQKRMFLSMRVDLMKQFKSFLNRNNYKNFRSCLFGFSSSSFELLRLSS